MEYLLRKKDAQIITYTSILLEIVTYFVYKILDFLPNLQEILH